MYSVVLMLSMTTAPDAPQGIIFNRGGCQGQVTAVETVRVRVRHVVEVRPIRSALVRVGEARPHLFHRRAGCAGTNVTVQATGCAGAIYKAGCVGATATAAVAPAAHQPATVGGHFIQRAAVHRVLQKALRQGKLTPEQAKVAKAALDDPDVYEAAVSKVTRDLNKSLHAKGGPVGAIGDGTLLQLLIDNLPKIIAAIKEIIVLFGMAGPQPMPAGPHPLPTAVPPDATVWLAA